MKSIFKIVPSDEPAETIAETIAHNLMPETPAKPSRTVQFSVGEKIEREIIERDVEIADNMDTLNMRSWR